MADLLALLPYLGDLALIPAGFLAGLVLVLAVSRLGLLTSAAKEWPGPTLQEPCWTEEIASDRRYFHGRRQWLNDELIDMEARLAWDFPNTIAGG